MMEYLVLKLASNGGGCGAKIKIIELMNVIWFLKSRK